MQAAGTVGLEAYVTGIGINDITQKQVHGAAVRCFYLTEDLSDFYKIYTVIATQDLHFYRKTNPNAQICQEMSSHKTQMAFLTKVDGNVKVVQEALPAAVDIGPATLQTICQGLVTLGRIMVAVRQIVGNLAAPGKVVKSLARRKT